MMANSKCREFDKNYARPITISYWLRLTMQQLKFNLRVFV